MVEAIRESRGIKILIGNLMTQPGETAGYSGADHVRAFEAHLGGRLFDVAVINRSEVPPALRARYRGEGSEPIQWDEAELASAGLVPIAGNLLADDERVRHDPWKLAGLLSRVCTGPHQGR